MTDEQLQALCDEEEIYINKWRDTLTQEQIDSIQIMSKDLTKYTKEELYNEIFRNYEDQVRILKEMIENRDKFITMLERQLENSDKLVVRLLDKSQGEEEGEPSMKPSRAFFDSEASSTTFPYITNEQKGVPRDGKEM